MELEILHETKEWIAINKPSGLVVEINPYEISVESILKEKYPFVGIVHRLDRVTSGILLLAKKKTALKILNKQFSDKTIDKTYQAWVENKPVNDKGTLIHFLFKDQLNKCAVISETEKTKYQKVELEYQIIEEKENKYLLELLPKTGKFHQIRAQLAFIGSPVLEDTKYNGLASKIHLKKIALRAYKLTFDDPKTKKRISLSLETEFRYNF